MSSRISGGYCQILRATLLFTLKVSFIAIVFKQKTFSLANLRGATSHSLAQQCPPLFRILMYIPLFSSWRLILWLYGSWCFQWFRFLLFSCCGYGSSWLCFDWNCCKVFCLYQVMPFDLVKTLNKKSKEYFTNINTV